MYFEYSKEYIMPINFLFYQIYQIIFKNSNYIKYLNFLIYFILYELKNYKFYKTNKYDDF